MNEWQKWKDEKAGKSVIDFMHIKHGKKDGQYCFGCKWLEVVRHRSGYGYDAYWTTHRCTRYTPGRPRWNSDNQACGLFAKEDKDDGKDNH
jgi:hypothetical protein